VEGFGQYGFAMALASIFMVLAESGLFLHQSRTFPSLKQSEDISRFLADGISLRLFLGIISGIVLVAIGLVSGKGAATTNLINLLAISILFSNIMGGYSAYLYGNEHFWLYGILSGSSQFITTCLGFIALYSGWGLSGIGFAQVAGSLITLLLVRTVVRYRFCWPAGLELSSRLSSLYKKSIPLGIAAILLVFYNRANFTLVSYFTGDNAAGIYNAAFALINGIALLAATFSSVMLPRFSALGSTDKKTLENLYGEAFKYLLILGMGIAFGAIAIGEPLIQALFSEKYIQSFRPLLILAFAGIFLYLNSIQLILLMARQANRQIIRMVGITSVANLITAVILIPQIGYIGAAIAMLLGESVGFVYGLAVNLEYLSFKRIVRYVAQTLSASLVMLMFLKYFHFLSLIWGIILGFMIFGAVLIAVRGFTRKDFSILAGVFIK
jgi:O-antigen/teichoic acid export membrane protein